MHRIIVAIIAFLIIIQTANAGYTSEETDEKSKSLYSAVTSILGTTDSSKHHHKHTYDSPACASGGCSATLSPCYSSTGCTQPTGQKGYSSGIGYMANPHTNVASFGHVTPQSFQTGSHGSQLPYQTTSDSYIPTGYIQPGSSNGSPVSHQGGYPSNGSPFSHQASYPSAGYPQPTSVGPYPYWNNNPNPSHYGYQGPRGYSVYDHSLKTNSEYTETGTHTGPLQHGNNGYGTGYGGSYNGLFNRPGF
ncbi:uncharacterized protein LOC119603133 [Lucilia sericata]|uniref:uncharacterized protein LOC119603133 n=1 Tax=Lucilia sericata TaxID=13632 RepID=UPI0018A82E52|nr:uncharacterized protein LOC119603133 [Lucilia sericata]